jgi:SAM-dependent methyltransferase
MDLRKTWKLFGKELGESILHPQYFLQKQSARRREIIEAHLKGKVLDIGSGDAEPRYSRKETVASYITLDLPQTNVRYLKRPQVFADAHALPFSEGVFDAVLLLEVLEHVRHPTRVLDEAHRVLREGGTVCLSTPFLYPLHDEPYDFFRFSLYGLREMLRQDHWQIVFEDEYSNFLVFSALSWNLYLMHQTQRLAEQSRYLTLIVTLPIVALLVLCANLLAMSFKFLFSRSRFPINYCLIARKAPSE